MVANNAINNEYIWMTSFTPTISGSTTAGAGTYSVQQGYYCVIGSLVFVQIIMTISAHTGTGNGRLTNLPFTVKNQGTYIPVGVFSIDSTTWTYTGNTMVSITLSQNTTQGNLTCQGPASGGSSNIAMSNSAATFKFSFIYQR